MPKITSLHATPWYHVDSDRFLRIGDIADKIKSLSADEKRKIPQIIRMTIQQFDRSSIHFVGEQRKLFIDQMAYFLAEKGLFLRNQNTTNEAMSAQRLPELLKEENFELDEDLQYLINSIIYNIIFEIKLLRFIDLDATPDQNGVLPLRNLTMGHLEDDKPYLVVLQKPDWTEINPLLRTGAQNPVPHDQMYYPHEVFVVANQDIPLKLIGFNPNIVNTDKFLNLDEDLLEEPSFEKAPASEWLFSHSSLETIPSDFSYMNAELYSETTDPADDAETALSADAQTTSEY